GDRFRQRIRRRHDGGLGFAGLLRDDRGLGRRSTRQLLFQLVDRLREFRERPAFRSAKRVELLDDVALVFGQLRGEIDELPGKDIAGAAHGGEDERNDQQHRDNASEPAFQSRDQGRKEKGEQRGQRERNQQVAPEIKRGNDE